MRPLEEEREEAAGLGTGGGSPPPNGRVKPGSSVPWEHRGLEKTACVGWRNAWPGGQGCGDSEHAELPAVGGGVFMSPGTGQQPRNTGLVPEACRSCPGRRAQRALHTKIRA